LLLLIRLYSIVFIMAKVGRPKDKDPRKPVVSRIRQSVINKLRKIADADKRSISTMIEIAVEEKYL
jgi:hypothetical protein